MKNKTLFSRHVLNVGWVTATAVSLLLALEWLFLVTKPSMFTVINWPQRGAILLVATLLAVIPTVVAAILIGWTWSVLAGRWRKHAGVIALLVPAAVLAAAVLLLIENFTKTVLGFNLGSFTSPVRYAYTAGWLLLCLRFHSSLARWLEAGAGLRRGPLLAGTAVVLVAALVAAGIRYEPQRAAERTSVDGRGELPNILILSTDGLNAASMSVYGYERRTTPFLESRADEFLISDNHFTNAVWTPAAIGTLLSGKLPLETGVLRAGDTFRGDDVFQHLPGLLRQLGYYNIDISARFYGDAYDMNIRQGFHVANGRSLRSEALSVLGWIGGAYTTEVYFVSLTLERLRERLLHAAGVADMKDSYNVVAKKLTPWVRDEDRIRLLEAEIERAPRPFFAHVHLLDTHRMPRSREGGERTPRDRFPVRKPHFSMAPDAQWFDYYDDTIAGYDDYVQRVVAHLEASNELDRTVLIINSDHGELRYGHLRLPLMIRFPNTEHRGRLTENTQRIDIAPTVLSYLGMDPPEWMQGQSLIGAPLDPLRPILVAGRRHRRTARWLAVVQCDRAQVFTVATADLEWFPVSGHTAPCSEGGLVDEGRASHRLFEHLEAAAGVRVPFEKQLSVLQRATAPEVRQRVMSTIRSRETPVLWLGESIAIAEAHPDHWTDGTRPAAILLRNDGQEARVHGLEVISGQGQEFPASFFVRDERMVREHVFPAPGSVSVELGPVAPGSERLFLVWSERSWQAADDDRQRGVRLLLSGSWLRDLLRDPQPREWQRAAELILEGRVPVTRLDEQLLAVNVHGDLWTRGSEPAALAVRNDESTSLVLRLAVQSGQGHRFPLRVHLYDGGRSREYVFERPGRMVVVLPEIPPHSERLVIIRSEGGWVPETRARRQLGVRLSLASG